MKNLDYPAVTKGEKLFQHMRRHLAQDDSLTSYPSWLTQINEFEEWNHYIEEFMILSLMGRILVDGRRLLGQYGDSSLFETELKSLIRHSLSFNKPDLNRMLRLTIEAIRASGEYISNGTRKSVLSWAKMEHEICYLCGAQMNFISSNAKRSFTIDHIWPRDFGGDSIIENLMPACKECNNEHKRNFPTWAMTNVHALILSGPSSLGHVEGCSRFAIQHRTVQRLAIDERLTLKDAYLQFGNSTGIKLIDSNSVAHFFNLATTN